MSSVPQTFRVRNLRKYQRYRDRKPLWFAVYIVMREDIDYNAALRGLKPTTDAEFGQIISILGMAVRYDDPQKLPDGPSFPFEPKWVQREARLQASPDLERLLSLCVIECNNLLQEFPNLSQDVTPYVSVSVSDSVSVSSSSEGANTKKERILADAQEVLGHLCRVTGRNFTNTRNIEACLRREKCTVDECKLVINFKWSEWGGDKKMAGCVDATTPWRASHFRDYLDQALAGAPRLAPSAKQMGVAEYNLASLNQVLEELNGTSCKDAVCGGADVGGQVGAGATKMLSDGS